jgi:hypothetical protein
MLEEMPALLLDKWMAYWRVVMWERSEAAK